MAVPTGIAVASASVNYDYAETVTKSDTVNLTGLCRALWVGGAGVVAGVLDNGDVVQFTVAASTLLPVRLRRVNSTTTTATLMVALY